MGKIIRTNSEPSSKLHRPPTGWK